MSLLMEALRKAEEAKRQSAQREKSNEDAQVSAVAAAVPVVAEMAELSALEAQIEDSQLEIAAVTPAAAPLASITPATTAPATTEELPEYRFELDFPEETPVAVTAVHKDVASEQDYSLDYPDEETQEDVSPAPERSQTLQPDARIPAAVIQQFEDSAAGNAPQATRTRESGLSLTLAEQPPSSRQVFMPELIVDELPTPSNPEIAAPAAPVPTLPPESPSSDKVMKTEPLVAEQAASVPLRAEPTDAPGIPRGVPPVQRSQAQRRESARAVFNAKAGSPAARRRQLIGVVVLLALFPLAGGGYFLLQELGIFAQGNQYNIPASYDPSLVPVAIVEESANAVPDATLPDVLAVADIVEAPVTEVLVAVETPVAEAIAAPVESPIALQPDAPVEVAVQAPVASPVEAASDVSSEVPLEVPSEVPLEAPSQAPSGEPSEVPVVEVAAATSSVDEAPAAPISIVRSSTPQIDPVIVQAYSAFQSRDYVDARALYQQALRATPNSRDAMLGIAAVAMLQGESTLARSMYTRLLEQDPRDALARAGLLETVPASDPVRTESELRSLFDAHPDVAPLAFALGNLYASQRRWNEAQQAYYDALRAAKAGATGAVSPDYAFNLAVSLERLNQRQPAYEFYREALQQSVQVQPNFDPRVLRQRLEDLERSLP